MQRDYGEMLGLATELQFMTGYLDTHELNQRAKIEASFKASGNRLVYDLLREVADPEEAARTVESDLVAIAESDEPPLWGAIDETRTYLLERIARESRKSPRLRTIVRWTPVAIGIVAAMAYFGLRYYNLLDLDAPARSREGIVQRAAAFEKALNHDPQGGFSPRALVRDIIMWPFEPTEKEIAAAREFFEMNQATFKRLAEQGEICLDPALHPAGMTPPQQVELVDQVADYVRGRDSRWAEPPIETLAIPIRRALPC